MLRIATFYESRLGRNDGNPLYVTACLKRMQYYGDLLSGRGANTALSSWFTQPEGDPLAREAAKKLWDEHHETLEVDHFYPTGEINAFGTYDLNIWTDWGEDGLTGVLPYQPVECPKPMAYWASDTHLGYAYRLAMARKADFVFCAQKRAIDEMTQDDIVNPIWLPHAVEPLAYPKSENLTKHFDVCFIGHVNSRNREDALDRLFREFPNFDYGQALFESAAERYGNAKVCFNIAMTDDVNMRLFEIMATGSFLLTNWIPTIETFFQDGVHLALYRTEEEMIDKVRYYLDHDEERQKIAQAGYAEVLAHHTIQHRVDKILDEFLKTRRVSHAMSETG